MAESDRRALLTFAAALGAGVPLLASTIASHAAEGGSDGLGSIGDPQALRVAREFYARYRDDRSVRREFDSRINLIGQKIDSERDYIDDFRSLAKYVNSVTGGSDGGSPPDFIIIIIIIIILICIPLSAK
jgi:hypothetical protein